MLGADSWDPVTVAWCANAGITVEKQSSHGGGPEHLTVQILRDEDMKDLMTAATRAYHGLRAREWIERVAGSQAMHPRRRQKQRPGADHGRDAHWS